MTRRRRPGGGAMGRGLWRFRRYGRPYVGALLAGVGLRIGELLADLAQPWPLAIIVDSVVGHKPLSGVLAAALASFSASRLTLLTAAVVASLVLAGASGILDYLGDRVMNGAGERITAAIRAAVFAHLQRLPLAYHDRHSIGELASRACIDTDRIEDALVDVFSTLLPGLLTIGGLCAMMLAINWRLGLIAVASGALVFITITRYMRLTREAARARRAREGALTGCVTETLSGIRTVHALGRHTLHDRRFADVNQATLAAGLRAVDLRARFTPLVEACTAGGTAALLWAGAWGVLHGAWSVGLLLVVLSYARTMLKPLRSLSQLSLTLSRGAASAERVAAVLDEPVLRTGEPDSPLAPSPTRARGKIALHDVTFGYGRGPVLKGIRFTVEPGERVAILGANGTGKSSLLALLGRLYDPEEGTILLDDHPIDHQPVDWLREQIAIVLQDTFLFSGSLWDNIAYGRPSAPAPDVRAAAEEALVSAFARDLPQGFDTLLGDRGVGLSGGQRQRVSIARALLRDAPIVLLDEPTSGLDLEAEQLVVAALRRLMAGRTVVMVTHRPALLALADRVVTLEARALVPAGQAASRSAPRRGPTTPATPCRCPGTDRPGRDSRACC